MDPIDIHSKIVTAFEGLNEEQLKAIVQEGLTRAVQARVRELIRYEFSKEIRDAVKKHKETLLSEEHLQPEDVTGLVTDALREVAAEHMRELVLRALK